MNARPAPLDDLRRQWLDEARVRGAYAVARAFSEADDALDDASAAVVSFAAAIEALRNEPEEPIGSPWRRSS